jgi:uncharacterized protein (TIGR02452 family)
MTLRKEPAIDSTDLAAARRRELDIPSERALFLGVSALQAARDGRYVADDGHTVDWKAAVENSVAAKVSLPPDAHLPELTSHAVSKTHVVVANETTLGVARRLTDAGLRPLSLNFANGVEPGGGVLKGARAQEEVLCRSSALLLTLDGDPMYEAHRRGPADESSDWVILSPDAPVFRRDDGHSLLLYLTQIPVVDITINRGRAASFSRSEPSEETAAASHTGTQEAAEPRCDAPTARTTMELAIECVDSTLPESSPASSRLARAQSEKNMGGFGGIT